MKAAEHGDCASSGENVSSNKRTRDGGGGGDDDLVVGRPEAKIMKSLLPPPVVPPGASSHRAGEHAVAAVRPSNRVEVVFNSNTGDKRFLLILGERQIPIDFGGVIDDPSLALPRGFFCKYGGHLPGCLACAQLHNGGGEQQEVASTDEQAVDARVVNEDKSPEQKVGDDRFNESEKEVIEIMKNYDSTLALILSYL